VKTENAQFIINFFLETKIRKFLVFRDKFMALEENCRFAWLV
jgi:hypothetical protein